MDIYVGDMCSQLSAGRALLADEQRRTDGMQGVLIETPLKEKHVRRFCRSAVEIVNVNGSEAKCISRVSAWLARWLDSLTSTRLPFLFNMHTIAFLSLERKQ